MFLDAQEYAGFHVLHVGGEVGGPDDRQLVEQVGDLLSGPGAQLILELSQVTYLNSTGIATLVRLNAQANVQEQRLVICNPAPLVEGVLRTTQLDRFFNVYPDLQSAVNAVR